MKLIPWLSILCISSNCICVEDGGQYGIHALAALDVRHWVLSDAPILLTKKLICANRYIYFCLFGLGSVPAWRKKSLACSKLVRKMIRGFQFGMGDEIIHFHEFLINKKVCWTWNHFKPFKASKCQVPMFRCFTFLKRPRWWYYEGSGPKIPAKNFKWKCWKVRNRENILKNT